MSVDKLEVLLEGGGFGKDVAFDVILLGVGILLGKTVAKVLMFHHLIFKKVLCNLQKQRLMILLLVRKINEDQL